MSEGKGVFSCLSDVARLEDGDWRLDGAISRSNRAKECGSIDRADLRAEKWGKCYPR